MRYRSDVTNQALIDVKALNHQNGIVCGLGTFKLTKHRRTKLLQIEVKRPKLKLKYNIHLT